LTLRAEEASSSLRLISIASSRESFFRTEPLPTTSLTLTPTKPYDVDALHTFFRARLIAGVEMAGEGAYARTFREGRATGTLKVSGTSKALTATITTSGAIDTAPVAARISRLFSLDAPASQSARHFKADRKLGPLVERLGTLRIPGCWDPFELGVRAILGQQVSVAGATTLAGRIARKFGTPLKKADGALTHLFPVPEELAEADLSGLGLTTRRAATITGFARAVSDDASLLDTSKPLDAFVEDLVALSGFGPWTAQYMAMRLGYPDAFPASDLGVRKALNMAPEKDVLKQAEPWRPYRATAVMYLWRSLG
jgi:AraC family transcriptional regulator of adaptative response / DNA-3-methyladenine glycosylase II